MVKNLEELKLDIERAATALLTDDEIRESLGISKAELNKHYSVITKARLKLKQQLNTRSITDAASNGNTAEIIDQIPRSKDKPKGQGGKREGAGRPKGSGNRITAAGLLRAIEAKSGKSFEELLTDGYLESIEKNDKNLRIKYEALIISKVMSNIVEMTPIETMSNEEIQNRIRALVNKAADSESDVQDNNGDNAE